MSHGKRFYRNYGNTEFCTFNVSCDTTDLFIRAEKDLSGRALNFLTKTRKELSEYIKSEPAFLTSLDPLAENENCPGIVKAMYRAGNAAGTGPMAAVAGAIAELTGRELLKYSGQVIVENGGDIWMSTDYDTDIGIYVDNTFFKNRLAIKIKADRSPCSICTSSSRLGHSLSFGNADSVTVIGTDGALADAVATGACNRVKGEDTLESAVEYALSIKGIRGCMAVRRDRIAAMGDIEMTSPS